MTTSTIPPPLYYNIDDDLLHDGVDGVGVDEGEAGQDCAGEGTGQAYADGSPHLVQANHTESSHSRLLLLIIPLFDIAF